MNILITVEYYWPKIGGAELVAQRIAEGLQTLGHSVSVATSYCANRQQFINGVRIYSFKIRGNIVKGIREDVYGEIKRYKELIISDKFDVIIQYAAQTWHVDLALNLLDVIPAKKILIPCGYSGLVLPSKKLFYYMYFKKLPRFLNKYNHIVYHSGEYIDKIFGDKHNIRHYKIIPNGITTSEIKSAVIDFRKHYRINEKYILLAVGNHYKLKNHEFIYDSFNKLSRSDVALVVIGAKTTGINSCFNKCTKTALKNERIYVLSDIQREHVLAAYQQADVFVSGSSVECFPIVILEAMAFNVPYITTNSGCVKELHGGIIVNNPSQMSNHINDLLNNLSMRQELGRSGHEQCMTKFTWNNIINRYNDLLTELI